MKTSFDLAFLKENCGCYKETEGKLQQVFAENGKTCFDEQICETSLQEIMSSNIPTEDKYWMLSNNVLSVEERKELFLLVMSAVRENTTDITRQEYIDTLIKYADKEVNYDNLYESWRKTPRIGWVIYDCDCYVSVADLGFGLYEIYWILTYLNRDDSVRDLVWRVVNEYINK